MSDSDGRSGDDAGSRDGRDDEGWRFDPDESGGNRDDPADPGDDPVATDDEGWRFDVDDVDEDGIVRQSIEPGQINPENAVFVLLGAIAMVVVVYQLYTLLT